MADSNPSSNPAGPSNGSSKPATPPKPQNPALRMLGLPNIRFKLPSRNWLIFLTITGSFTGALIYDRREKRKAQQKWSNLVAHIAHEPLSTRETRRKLAIFLSPPPGDGLRPAREHFQEYVKPVLVAAAMDYEVYEGRREGDIRAALAKKIRKERCRAGESPVTEGEEDVEDSIRSLRQATGIHDETGERGDLVIGRHTWKEYIRGLHEGWLGPLNPPPAPEPENLDTPLSDQEGPDPMPESAPGDQASPQAEKESEKPSEQKKEPEKPKRPPPTPAYIPTSEYPSHDPSPSIPQEFQGNSPIAFPHILGFLNTPIRIYRFLTRRYLADDIGREVAAVVLASSTRPYSETEQSTLPNSESDASPTSSSSSSMPNTQYEQQTLLQEEEKDWHKSVRKPAEDPTIKEREWLDNVVVDPRIGSRMRRFNLPPDEEVRAGRIAEGKEWVKGEEEPPHIPVWKRLWQQYGWEEEDPRANVVIGNIDGEDGE